MALSESHLEARVAELAAEVQVLSARVALLEGLRPAGAAHAEVAPPPMPDSAAPQAAESGEVNIPQFFSAVATVSFLLVVALMLRTVVDNDFIAHGLGVALGMSYAVVLLGAGYVQRERGRRWGSLYAACGLFLLLPIILEAHKGFQVIGAPAGYGMLGAAVVFISLMSMRHPMVVPAALTLLGAPLVALLLEHPTPDYRLLALTLLLGVCGACLVSGRPRLGWLLWAALPATLFFWIFWMLKLGRGFAEAALPPAALHTHWYIPLLGLSGLVYFGQALWRAVGRQQRFGFFDALLPAVTLTWTYLAARSVLTPWLESAQPVGLAGLAFAAGCMVLGWAMTRSARGRAASAFVGGGIVLAVLAAPSAAGATMPAALLLAVGATTLAWTGNWWGNREVRSMSHVLQLYVGGMVLLYGGVAAVVPAPWPKIAATLLLFGISLFHYLWCRRHPAPAAGGSLAWLDPAERTLTLVLLAALVYAFEAFRLLIYPVLAMMLDDSAGAFQSVQSVFINACAIVLMLAALRRVNMEYFVLGLVLGAVGAVKVFCYDLPQLEGLPVVMSVLSFGITAAVASLSWTRCQRGVA